MKKFSYILGLFVLLIAGSCSEDFTVSAPYRDITVVYGIINSKDTNHYIRIQKAFMDEHKSAITMSKVTDSSFYKDLSVNLLEYSTDRNTVLNTFPMYRVDLNREGIPEYVKHQPLTDKNFFADTSYAYKLTNPNLKAKYWYRMLITNNATGRTDSSEFIGLVNSDSSVNSEGSFFINQFNNAAFSVEFAKTGPANRFELFSPMPKHAQVLEGVIRFKYVDKNVVNNTQEDKYVDYPFATVAKSGTNVTTYKLTTLNTSIYAFLRSSIGPAPENVERYMDSCDVYVYAGSPEIFYADQINQGQSGGLTGDNIQPNYTNFRSSDVIGIVGSRAYRVFRDAAIEKVTMDSLMTNATTEPLHIRGVSDH